MKTQNEQLKKLLASKDSLNNILAYQDEEIKLMQRSQELQIMIYNFMLKRRLKIKTIFLNIGNNKCNTYKMKFIN